jgi:hypothetical protein
MSYKILRGRWCNIIILNVHAQYEDKGDDSFYEELNRIFDQFPRYYTKIILGAESRQGKYLQTDDRKREFT